MLEPYIISSALKRNTLLMIGAERRDLLITDKEDDKINWDTTDRTTPVEELL